MIRIKTTVSDCYDQAREALKAGDRDKARDLADFGIVKVEEARHEGMDVDETLGFSLSKIIIVLFFILLCHFE